MLKKTCEFFRTQLKKLLTFLGYRKWEYYEEEFGTLGEKTFIHLRICNYTDKLQVYNQDKKKFVNYNNI